MTEFLPPQKPSEVFGPSRHTSQLLSAARAPRKARSRTRRKSHPINAALREPRLQSTWEQLKDRSDPGIARKLPKLLLQRRSVISIASKRASNIRIHIAEASALAGLQHQMHGVLPRRLRHARTRQQQPLPSLPPQGQLFPPLSPPPRGQPFPLRALFPLMHTRPGRTITSPHVSITLE